MIRYNLLNYSVSNHIRVQSLSSFHPWNIDYNFKFSPYLFALTNPQISILPTYQPKHQSHPPKNTKSKINDSTLRALVPKNVLICSPEQPNMTHARSAHRTCSRPEQSRVAGDGWIRNIRRWWGVYQGGECVGESRPDFDDIASFEDERLCLWPPKERCSKTKTFASRWSRGNNGTYTFGADDRYDMVFKEGVTPVNRAYSSSDF